MSDESSEEAEFSGNGDEDYEQQNDDEDEPLLEAKTPDEGGKVSGRSGKKRVSYTEQDDSDDDDDDDDVPLSELAKKSKNGAGDKKKKAPAKKAKEAAKKKPKTTSNGNKKAAPAKKTFDYASAALYGTECEKGKLIQNLLRRWWYAYDWPSKEIAEKEPPEQYDRLDGFPGVFVCTSGDNVGHILDERDPDTRPCFEVFAKKSTEELKELLSKAIEGQLKVLKEHEHEHDTSSVRSELKKLQKWVAKLPAIKSDKEASKVLKAHKLKLKDDS